MRFYRQEKLHEMLPKCEKMARHPCLPGAICQPEKQRARVLQREQRAAPANTNRPWFGFINSTELSSAQHKQDPSRASTGTSAGAFKGCKAINVLKRVYKAVLKRVYKAGRAVVLHPQLLAWAPPALTHEPWHSHIKGSPCSPPRSPDTFLAGTAHEWSSLSSTGRADNAGIVRARGQSTR